MNAIAATIPVLASLNISESLDFYVQRLGFRERLRMDDYGIVSRDEHEIHFWLCSDAAIPPNTSCYVRTGNVDAVFEEFARQLPELQAPQTRPWGMRELYVYDPHCNLIKFGQRL